MDDLKIIKNKYGEKMMHLCKELFPSILETPGKLSSLMLEHIEPTKFLYNDLDFHLKTENFKDYIYNLIVIKKRKVTITEKTPQELMNEAGYILYKCESEEEIQSFKKYYAPDEELCTFNGERLNTCYVFFAVKKNVDEIKRENFPNPKREDEYGTSVISIQFRRKGVNTLSIKNRYNHTVNNPDNTFNNDLDNIIPGLTESFKKEYKLNFESNNNKLELPGYVYVNGKYYKYNYEINNIYYCPNNIIIDNFKVIDKYSKEPERYIVLDYFIIDLKEKTIKLYDENITDSFQNTFGNIEKITITKDKNTKEKTIEIINDNKKATITINNKNQIIGYHNNFLIEMEDNFLIHNTSLKTIEVENLIKMGNNCLEYTPNLIEFNGKSLVIMGKNCLNNTNLPIFNAENLTEMGESCLKWANMLTTFSAKNLIKMNECCLANASNLITFNVPNLTHMETFSLHSPTNLTTFFAPNLTHMEKACLNFAPKLTTFSAESLTEMDDSCLMTAPNLTTVNTPNLTKTGTNCFKSSKNITTFNAPVQIKEQYFKEHTPHENNPLYQTPITKVEKNSSTLENQLNETITNATYDFKNDIKNTQQKQGGNHKR